MSGNRRAYPTRGYLDQLGVPLEAYNGDNYNDIGLVDARGQMQQLPPAGPLGYDIDVEVTNMFEEGEVPIINVSVDVLVNEAAGVYGDTADDVIALHDRALSAALARINQSRNNLYGQSRLLDVGDSLSHMFDLTTAMVPIDDLQDEFAQNLSNAMISNRNITFDTGVALQFRFTFVVPAGVTPDLVARTTAANRAMASNARQRREGQANSRLEANRRFTEILQWENANQNASVAEAIAARRAIRERIHREEAFEILQTRYNAVPGAGPNGVAAINAGAPVVPPIPLPAGPRNRQPRRRREDIPLEERMPIRGPLDARKRDQYNAQRRQRRLNADGPNAFGVYEDYKKRIFHHKSLDEFFLHSKAVLEVPTTHKEGHCLAMAFLRSQSRSYDMKTGEAREVLVRETIGDADIDSPGSLLMTVPILPPYLARLDGLVFPFLKRNSESGQMEGVLFNPFRSHRPGEDPLAKGAFKYQNVLQLDEIQAWYTLAQNFHHYVQLVIEESYPDIGELNPNKEEVLQFYADVTQTVICVYRLQQQGKRTNTFIPFNYSRDLREQGTIRVVSMLINDEHATAITNLRDFVQNKVSANRTTINGYCLCCEKISTSNNSTRQKSAQHFVACFEKTHGELQTSHQSEHKHQQVSTYSAPQFAYNVKTKGFTCRTCQQEIGDAFHDQIDHVCRVQFADIKFGEEADLYVYDLECAQIEHLREDSPRPYYIHEVNLVCVRRVYPDAEGNLDRHFFESIETFMHYVMSLTASNRIYLAHNGGRYDVQFVMQYLEANLIPHTFIPTPTSIHAYLSVSIPFGAKISATFLDFRNFMPGSLKNIGISFGLEVAKGDFPHRFNNGFNDNYEGSLPPINDIEDFWCLSSKRSEEDEAEFRQFYAEQCNIYCHCGLGAVCSCTLEKWNFKDQLLKYCWLDVDVLAEACAKYRNNALDFGDKEIAATENEWVSNGIDPFQYLTIPQLAINLLLNGMPENNNLTITPSKLRKERVPLAIPWMEQYMRNHPGSQIAHIGNSNKEFYCFASKRYLDGIDIRNHRYFVCLDCSFHGCRRCFFDEFEVGQDHPCRPATYSRIHRDTEEFVATLLRTYGPSNVEIVWSHQLEQEYAFTPYELQLGSIMKERDMFYGGRTEVFAPYVDAKFFPEDSIQYHDVCSLYPYVCAFKTLPTGNPEHICGSAIEIERITDLAHHDPYFGYIRAKVTPHRRCLIGLLPYRCPATQRLEFPLRPMIGSWGTEEMRIAIENGYVVEEVYEVYHWPPQERSDTLLRGYVSFFLRMKQEAEGWKKMGASSETPSEEEKLEIQEKVFEQSGRIGRIRLDKVDKNPVKRQMAKLFLNSLWGKFCQKPNKDHFVVIHGYQQFASLWFDSAIDKSKFSFRHISNNTWKVKFSSLDAFTKSNPKYNIFLASKVTEEARCILHRQMLRIGPERILYCDTDSIMFLYPKAAPKCDGLGLGNWINEYPHGTIQRLFALAPKFYFLEFQDGESLLKSKGIQMTLANSKLIHAEKLGLQLMEKFFPFFEPGATEARPFTGYMTMANMIMGINSTNSKLGYGRMLTRYTDDKKVRPVISKRQFVPHFESNVPFDSTTIHSIARIHTIPHGYYRTCEEVAKLVYATAK